MIERNDSRIQIGSQGPGVGTSDVGLSSCASQSLQARRLAPSGPVGGGAPASHGGTPSPGVYPPMLTGGLKHIQGALSEGVDFLTVTVPAGRDLADLLAETRLDEPGRAVRGFQASETRLSLGGSCWRRYRARQASREWSTFYESWEWSGSSASWPSLWLRGRLVRPTRVDLAFDFRVDDCFTADDLAGAIAGHGERRGLSPGVCGQGGRNTRYVGSSQSEKRIRIYRKDWQDDTWAALWGPTLRVELVLKGSQAAAWWGMWAEDTAAAMAAGAGIVADMIGWRVRDDLAPAPEVVQPEASALAERVLSLLDQCGATLVGLVDAGVPVVDLARVRLAVSSRATKWRVGKIGETVEEVGLEQLVWLVRELMGLARESGATDG